jgi:phosphoserine phosphatase
MRVYLFDVCGTLFRDDTTLGFLNFVVRNHKSRSLWLSIVSSRRSPVRWGLALAEKLTGRAWIRDCSLLVLRGYSRAQVDRWAREYVAHLLEARREAKPFALFEKALGEFEVVLASASLEPVVGALAEKFSVSFVASSLAWSADRCQGYLQQDLSGTKEQAILSKLGSNYVGEGCHCVSDNFSDRSLLEKCQGRTVVLRRPSHRNFWNSLEAEFIEVFV